VRKRAAAFFPPPPPRLPCCLPACRLLAGLALPVCLPLAACLLSHKAARRTPRPPPPPPRPPAPSSTCVLPAPPRRTPRRALERYSDTAAGGWTH
jgi:hypothetical protein